MGLTTIIVGKLNLISVAFAVLFIGLSVDYGIQIYSRILESQFENENKKLIKENVKKISNTLLIASVPSMIGFISFIPTDYTGLSELGIISFIGLLVGLITNLLFFSSLLIVFNCNLREIVKPKKMLYEKFFNSLKKKNNFFLTLFFIGIFTSLNFKKINFDSDALNLKDNNLKSVILAKQLIEENPTSDYIISIVLKEESFNNWEGLETLLSKKTVKSIFSYKDLIDDYKNEDLDYFKFLISSQIDKSFYSSNDDLFEFKKILKRISQTNYSNLSDESADLLNIIEKNVANEEDYKKLQKLFFLNLMN